MQIILANAQVTRVLGIHLGQTLAAGSILLLTGDLGSGKTCLVQGIGEGLGITEPIVSPTFTLINEYEGGRLPLYHLDLYRLQPEEVKGLNLANYWDDAEYPLGIVAIEWAQRLPSMPPTYLKIAFSYAGDRRLVEFVDVGGQLQLENLLANFC